MFMGIDIQGKSISLCDPTQKLKLQQQQQQQAQAALQLGSMPQKEGQLPNMMMMIMGANSISNNTNGTGLQYQTNGGQGLSGNVSGNQQLVSSSATKQQMKYNSPLSHQFKIGHSNKLEYIRQQQAHKYNQLYQLDPQLQQQQQAFQLQVFQQQQAIQQQQLLQQQQQQLQINNNSNNNNSNNNNNNTNNNNINNVQSLQQSQVNEKESTQFFPPFNNNNNTNSNNTNNTLLQQYLNNPKSINNSTRENSGTHNFNSEQSPSSVSSTHNTQFAANILRNSNIISQQNEYRFQQIQQTHQLFSQLVMNQQAQSIQSQSNQNPSSQSPQPLHIPSLQPVVSIPNYFNQQQSQQQQQQQTQQQQQQQQQLNNNSALNGQQQLMFNSSENFAQKNALYSCVGNPNNPYNHHLNNPYLQEKRYYKSSKLPKIRKEKGQPVTFSDIRPSSREKSARFHLTTSINQIANQNNAQSNCNNENIMQGKGQNNTSNQEKQNVVQSETTISNKSTISGQQQQQQLNHQQSLSNITSSAAKENNSLTTSNQASKKTYDNINSLDNDEDEKAKCIRYFRYNLAQLLYILGKKENYFNNLNFKKPIKTFAIINQPIGQKHLNQLSKNTINIINKVKKLVATKGKYKYRERFNFTNSAQLKSINYDVRKRLNQLQDKKILSSCKSKDEYESSDEDETPVKTKNNNRDAVQQTDLAKWKKYNKLDAKTKVFIIKGGYGDLRKALLDRGWVENTDYFSPCFDFKWTCKVQDIDYDNLQDFQIVNHFDNNQVFTSKYGLSRNLRTLIHSENTDVYKFFPRCFDLADLQEFEDFIENFKVAKAESLIHKFKDLLQNGIENIDDKVELKIRLCNEIVSRKFLDFYEQIDFIFNQELLPCVSPEEWDIISKDEFQIEHKKMENYLDKLRNHPNLKNINSQQNKAKQHQVKRKGSHRMNAIHNHHETIEEESFQSSTSLKQAEQLSKQNKKATELLDLCNQTLQKSSEKDPQHHLNGYRNIWIVKPNFLSRGRGIKCFNNLDKIMDYVVGKETQFVVQKYIENPLLINNKKFDMRQWAIVQDFCPPRIWFFDECYIRLCSVDHNIDDLNNRFVHLTNNVIQKCNKEGYTDKDDLMMSQEQFADYLKETEGRDIFYDEIQPKLKQMIIQSLKCCQDQVGARKNSMEFVGYDFMIDSNYQPWLIEINSSPSMEYSTSITKELVQRVLEDTTKVVVDYSLAKKGTKKYVETGGFKLIYKGEKQLKSNKIISYKK